MKDAILRLEWDDVRRQDRWRLRLTEGIKYDVHDSIGPAFNAQVEKVVHERIAAIRAEPTNEETKAENDRLTKLLWRIQRQLGEAGFNNVVMGGG